MLTYHPTLAALKNYAVSGVYAFFSANSNGNPGECLYVGESHSGRLFDTITRHFRAWKVNPRRDATGRRFGGTTYDRRRVFVHWFACPADEALVRQFEEIQRLDPKDNTHDGRTIIAERVEDDIGDLPV